MHQLHSQQRPLPLLEAPVASHVQLLPRRLLRGTLLHWGLVGQTLAMLQVLRLLQARDQRRLPKNPRLLVLFLRMLWRQAGLLRLWHRDDGILSRLLQPLSCRFARGQVQYLLQQHLCHDLQALDVYAPQQLTAPSCPILTQQCARSLSHPSSPPRLELSFLADGLSFGGGIQSLSFGIITAQALYTLHLLRQVRALSHEQVGCCRAPENDRLKRRLRYFVSRYGSHAPYWQFVVWARQVGLMVATAALKEIADIPQSAIVLGELVLLMLLQWKWKPYPQARQNVLELGGFCVNFFILIFGMIYTTVRSSVSSTASLPIDLAMLVLFVLCWLGLVWHFVKSSSRRAQTEAAGESATTRSAIETTDDVELKA